jgi:glycosyltransferase involved in cell wall biosynthesis
MPVEVAVVVPTYQRADRLRGLVEALERQTLPLDRFEVIISDDRSTDATPEILASIAATTPLRFRFLRAERNSGPAHARNVAWRSTQAPIIACVDDDCLPVPEWLEAGVAKIRSSGAGIVQGRTLPVRPRGLRRRDVSQRIDRLSKRYEGCNIFYRREVLEDTGGFDETIYFFGEDSIPAFEGLRRGYDARFAYDALVLHEVRRRGLRWHIRWALLHRHWPMLVRRYPELRREALWLRFFLTPRHAELLTAAAGIGLGVVWHPAFVLAVPALARYSPSWFRRDEFEDALGDVAYDTLVMIGLLVGSVRYRRLVI